MSDDDDNDSDGDVIVSYVHCVVELAAGAYKRKNQPASAVGSACTIAGAESDGGCVPSLPSQMTCTH